MTTRRLVLVRHSKAEAHGGDDAARALAPRGLRDAGALGRWLAAQGVTPDYVVVSPVLRTRQTWAGIAAELPTAPDPVLDGRIYDNSVEDLLAVIAEAPAAAQTVMVVGHNPSMHALASGVADFPTSAVAVYDVDAAWSDLTDGLGTPIASAAPRG